MLFDSLIGNEKLKATIASDIRAGRTPHACILEGPEGSGRHTAAKLIASAILCCDRNGEHFPCGKCLPCRKVSEDICTDVITVNRGSYATLGIDVIRDLKASLAFAPVEMERKIYIIEEADKMTAAAQNSLLLSLEEPPEFVSFIMICTDASLLLETVRSRAPVIKMQLFSASQISSYLASNEKTKKAAADPAKLSAAAAASRGAIGKAVKLLTDKNAPELKQASLCREILPSLLSRNLTKRLDAIKKFPASREDVISFLSVLTAALRDLVAWKKAPGSELMFFTDSSEVKALCAESSLTKLMSLFSETVQARVKISANVNIQPVLTLLASK